MKHKTLTSIILALSIAAFSSSCQKDTPVSTIPDYTIMLYGCGGGNLDDSLIKNLKQAIYHGRTDKVDMVCEMKMSKAFKENVDVGTLAGTFRMELGAKKDTTGMDLFKYPTTRIGGDDVRLDDPQTLTEFIKWAAGTHPAKEYVLVLWDHGKGWEPKRDTLRTKSMIRDDNTGGHYLTQQSFLEGVIDSGVHFKCIYSDLCLMGMLECLCDYASIADYHLGCCETTPSLGGDYFGFIEALNSAGTTDAGFEKSMDSYCTKLADWWLKYAWMESSYSKGEEASDIGWVNLRKLPAVTEVVKRISAELCASYDKYKDAYDKASTSTMIMDEECPYLDSCKYFDNLASFSGNQNMVALAAEYKTALANAQHRVTSRLKTEDPNFTISIAISLYSKEEYEQSKLSSNYYYTAFDKQTRWSDWMKINAVSAKNNPGRQKD